MYLFMYHEILLFIKLAVFDLRLFAHLANYLQIVRMWNLFQFGRSLENKMVFNPLQIQHVGNPESRTPNACLHLKWILTVIINPIKSGSDIFVANQWIG